MKNIKDLINFSVNDARVVCVLADVETSAETSRQLNITQSLVNAIVVRTEEKLNSKLFIRDKKNKKFLPTAEARDILPTLKTIVQLADQMLFSPINKENTLKGKVKLSSSHTILEHYLGPYIKDLMHDYPEIEISFNNQDNMSSAFQDPHEIDITCILDDRKNYKYFPYHSFKQKFWASQEYIEKFGFPRTLDDLSNHIFLMRRHTDDPAVMFGSKLLKAEAKNLPNFKVCEISGVRLIDYLCKTGCGISAWAEESIKIVGANLVNVLPDFSGDSMELFIKVHRELAERPLGKFIVNWIFQCRDNLFKKHKIPLQFPHSIL